MSQSCRESDDAAESVFPTEKQNQDDRVLIMLQQLQRLNLEIGTDLFLLDLIIFANRDRPILLLWSRCIRFAFQSKSFQDLDVMIFFHQIKVDRQLFPCIKDIAALLVYKDRLIFLEGLYHISHIYIRIYIY